MRNILFKLIIAGSVLISMKANAQIDNRTSSNPANPKPTTGVGSNLWDWTSQITEKGSFNGNGAMYYNINPTSSMYGSYSVPPIMGSPIGIESPYYNSASTQLSNYVAFGSNSDFKWSDGWEVITRNFGYAYDEVSTATSDAIVPYFVLYNKYSGTLRVFGVLPTRGGGGNVNSVAVELKFLTPSDEQHNAHYQSYKYSALLGVNGGSSNPDPVTGIPYGKAQALDMPTTVNNIVKVCPFTGYDNQFFYADFAVGYDPCSCWNSGGLQVSFYTNTTGSILLSGRFVGTNVPIADVLNGNNSDTDPVNYLAGVNTKGNNVASGTLVYQDINSLGDDYYSTQQNNTNTNKDKEHLEAFSKGASFAAKEVAIMGAESGNEEAEAAAGFLEALALLSDFVAALIPAQEGESSTVSVIQGEMALSGSLNLSAQNPEAFIKFTNPGTPQVVSSPPEFYTANNPVPNYPKYNEVLGPFALLQTPSVNVSEFHKTFTIVNGGSTNDYYRDEFQITDPLKYIFNPSIHANISKTVVLASLELEYVGVPPNPQGFPYPGGFSVRGATWSYTDQINSNLVSMHYSTDFVDPSQLPNMIVAVENTNGYYGPPSEFNVYLKLIVNIVSDDLKADGVTPNQSILMFTYPITVYNENRNNPPNLTGFPFNIMPVDNQNTACDCVAPNSITLGTTAFFSTLLVLFPPTPLPNPYIMYSWGDIKVTGALTTVGSGKQANLLSYDGQVSLQPGASMSPGVSMAVGHAVVQPNTNSGPWTGTGNLKTWCQGTAATLPNPYKGSTLATNIPAAKLSAKATKGVSVISANNTVGSDIPEVLTASIDIYPNPISDIASIKYTVPAAGYVEIAIYSLLGEKILDIFNGDQNAGKYTQDLTTDSMESGIYLLSIKTVGFTNTQRMVVIK